MTARLGTAPRQPLLGEEPALLDRIAAVLDCSADDVRVGWRSSNLEWIGVRRGNHWPELTAADIATLLVAGFGVSELGWDVPGDVGRTAEKGDQDDE